MMTTNLAADSEVLAPGQDGYAEAAATVFAAGTPELIMRPHDAAGVATALRFAVDAEAPVSVRSGGHSLAGFGTHDSGMIIDLRHLSAVRILDHGSRRVRIGAGASWGAVAGTLQQAGLALTAGDTASVGVGGLMLSGGIGWMVRKHGLAIDNLTGADLVTPDGHLVHTDAEHHAGLFWALRGLGGAFGWAAPDATAFAHRDAEFLCVAGVMLPPGVPQERAARALAAWPDVAVHGSGAYVGFLQSAAATDIAAAYPAATYERLAAVKRHYDPGNVLRRNHNIRPA
jgi:FAD/FMN-containing dehydrogenase